MRILVCQITQQRQPATRLLVLLLLAIVHRPTFAQTPWQSAPAKPAPYPARLSPAAKRVVSLPAPPSGSSAGLSTPDYVPLAARPTTPSEANGTGQSKTTPPSGTSGPAFQGLPLPPASANQGAPRRTTPQLNAPQFAALPPSGPTTALPYASASPQSGPQPGTLIAFGTAALDPTPPEEFPAGRLIAVVGTDHILAGDMAVFVEPIIEQNRNRIKSAAEEQKLRNQLTRQALPQYVQIKAVYLEFFRDMVGAAPPKELNEMRKKVATQAGKIFYEKQVPQMMKRYEVSTIAELEKQLAEKSQSLLTMRRQFIEQVLASELERKYVPEKFEVHREELLDAYRDPANQEKWEIAGRARWRQLTVRFDKHQSRDEVEQLIRQMGDEIYLGGKPFEAVAKQLSEGYTAEEGGVYDWTTQGSLKSKELDGYLFSLPLNQLSRVIEDDIGLHIIEVLEREAGHTQDFTEAQVELREILSNEKRDREVKKFRDKVMARTTVWTLWPEDIAGSRPLSDALGAAAN